MPNFTDEELRKHDEEVAAKAATTVKSQVESEIVKDTSWKSLEAMKESALNADKRIGESVLKEKEAVGKLVALEVQLAEVKKSGGKPPEDGKKDDDLAVKDPASFLRTMSEAEEKKLDEMTKSNPALRKEILASGEVGMAKALQHLRKIVPAESQAVDPEAPFGSWRKNVGKKDSGGAVALEDLLSKAHEDYQKRHRIPGSSGSRTVARSEGEAVDEDAPPPKRAGGGMRVMAAPGHYDE